MLSSAVPVVGVTTYCQQASWGPWDRVAALVPATYVASVAAAGARPVLVPPCDVRHGEEAAAAVVDALDALVLAGGGDIDPARYGQAAHAATAGVDPGRDASEMALLQAALAADLPVLAICRGMQLLNVHLGGTLIQHVPDAVGHAGHQPAAGCFAEVEVRTEAGSLAADVVGASTVVRCSHHQAVAETGAGLAVTARAEDGLVEAVELTAARFVLGVQWHPEENGDVRLFDALVDSVG